MIYLKQKWHCNCCGEEMFIDMIVGKSSCVGREWKCCSLKCYEEIKWRKTLSILGKKYRSREDANDE